MKLAGRKRRALLQHFEQKLEGSLSEVPARMEPAPPRQRSAAGRMALTASWVSASLGIIALGIYTGREIRSRYRFKRLTPYDFYSHSGDRFGDADLSVGV